MTFRWNGFRTSATMALAAASAAIASVTVHDDTDQGRPCFRVETASATYYFQKESGGFSSIVDKNGNDWISFKPDQNSGSAGEYRGLPNLGECCHPGYPDYRGEGVSMTSEAQQADGSVIVPEVLRPIVGKDILGLSPNR